MVGCPRTRPLSCRGGACYRIPQICGTAQYLAAVYRWGPALVLKRSQDAAPRNPHHCSTNCRDTTGARNTPWMGNKGRDIPEPDILRAAGIVEHCNSQHSAVLVLGRMG